MASRVVCFSGPDGSGMREVAAAVAEQLGFALVDEEVIVVAAASAGVDSDLVADVERRRSFIERAFDSMAAGADSSAFVVSGVLPQGVDGKPSDDLRAEIRAAIEEIAGRQDVVIVAHAASHALGSRPGVLRVLVTASQETRLERVAAERELDDRDARRAVLASDAGRADYLKRFYGEKQELPTQFDLVVNTDRVTPEQAIALVMVAAGG